METRLIIAYLLITVMIALVIFGGIMLFKKQNKLRRRNTGRSND